MDIQTLTQAIDDAAPQYQMGGLQNLRHKLGKNPRTKKIFTKSTIKAAYAFNDGGRKELQVNIGLEERDGRRYWRHGVAFSFERSQALTDPNVLRPSVRRFNAWVTANSDLLNRFRMWVWEKHGRGRSEDRAPHEILKVDLEEFVKSEKFVFLGKIVPESKVDVAHILRDLDDLYELYEYCLTEVSNGRLLDQPVRQRQVSDLARTKASRLASEIEVELRHNVLQAALTKILKAQFSDRRVHPERSVSQKRRIDVAIDMPGGNVFCEIKIAPNVRTALRLAIGQLLEYTHWPNDGRAVKWWVISEEAPTEDDVSYLQNLRARYSLPLFYRQIDAEAEALGPET